MSQISIELLNFWLCLLALRDLRLRLGLDPIAGDGYCSHPEPQEGIFVEVEGE